MVHFIAFFQAAQNGNGVFHTGFTNIDLLKTALESCIFFNMLTKLIECGGANHAQFTTSQHRLNHVARVHCAFCTASTHQRMHFIDESNDIALSVGDFFEYRLQSLFKLAAVFRTSNHRGNVE